MSYYADKPFEIPQTCPDIDSVLKLVAEVGDEICDLLNVRFLPSKVLDLLCEIENMMEMVRSSNSALRDVAYQNGLVADSYAHDLEQLESKLDEKDYEIRYLEDEARKLADTIYSMERI